MKPEQLKQMLARASKSVQKANLHLMGGPIAACPSPEKHRIRQDRSGPNKLETEWGVRLKATYPNETFRFGCLRFRLGNGIWYKPDFTCSHHWCRNRDDIIQAAWEVKGPKSWRGGFENLKVAATTYTDWTWYLVYRSDGRWKEERVLP